MPGPVATRDTVPVSLPQADKEVLIATPAVLKWLRMAVFLERSMTIIYPTLFILLVAVYWSIFLTAYNARGPESEDP